MTRMCAYYRILETRGADAANAWVTYDHALEALTGQRAGIIDTEQ